MNISNIFEIYRKQKENIEISLDRMKEDLGDLQNKIVLYGAGSAGIAFLYYLRDAGIEPKYFADGNPVRWGMLCEGLEILDYHKIPEVMGQDALVIVTINTDGKRYCKSFTEMLREGGHTGVHKKLHDAGCMNVIDYTYFRRVHSLFHGGLYNLPSCSDISVMEEHIAEMEKVYSLLADKESREVFEKIIYFRMVDDTISIPTRTQDKQYFEYEFFKKSGNEIFVDCGAYNGISLKTFLQENSSFEKYYGFEPDRENFLALQKYVADLPEMIQKRICIIPKAVYDREGEALLYSLHGPGSFLADIGMEKVETITIDHVLSGERASFIKMNIEGSEIQALQGAEKTIEMYRPKLAIAGYHKTKDLWEVPLLLYKIIPGYKFYLRSYMNHLSFVYYGV